MHATLKKLALLPLAISQVRAWNATFNVIANCARYDVESVSYTGEAGVTDPSIASGVATDINPVMYQTVTVTDWDDGCTIEFYDTWGTYETDPVFTLEKSDERYVHSIGGNKVCVADLDGDRVTGDGSYMAFRYMCDKPDSDE